MTSRFHLVEPGLWVGSCPTGAESSRALALAGVGGVLSLQTDDDLRALGLRWEVIWGAHVAAGLAVERVPIRDFDKKHLAASVDHALAALEALAAGGRGVLVHCTAGLNRSPTIVIAALAARHGLTLDEATRRLMAAHPDAIPYVDALARWSKRRPRR